MPNYSEDKIDMTIINYAKNKEIDTYTDLEQIRYIPSDGERKHSTMLLYNNKTKEYILTLKGAPQKIFEICNLNKKELEKALLKVEEFGKLGFRTIAVASKSLGSLKKYNKDNHLEKLNEENSKFLGLISLSDVPRKDAKKTISEANEMNIQIKMLTGDHTAAAHYIANQIGIIGNEITSAEMDKLNKTERALRINNSMIFSEVLPSQKYEIVKALQANGEVVAVTGDGVNDAPALKSASVGIAVEGATEVARSVADLVLTSPGLAVIINGIKEGRAIYKRMYHYINYRLAETFRILFLVPFSILFFGFFPLTPIQLVLLSVLNDIPILAMATDRVSDSKVPEKWRLKRLMGVSSVLGFVGLLSSGLLLMLFVFILNLPLPVIQTLLFLKLSISGHLMVFHARSKGPVLKGIKPSKILLISILVTQLIATTMALLGIFVEAVPITTILLMWGWVIIFFFITELFKHWIYKY